MSHDFERVALIDGRNNLEKQGIADAGLWLGITPSPPQLHVYLAMADAPGWPDTWNRLMRELHAALFQETLRMSHQKALRKMRRGLVIIPATILIQLAAAGASFASLGLSFWLPFHVGMISMSAVLWFLHWRRVQRFAREMPS